MVRYLADASLRDAIVTGCLRQKPAIDFLSAYEAGLEGVPDSEVLIMAARYDRILVTSDLRTMPEHFGEHLATQIASPGVFLIKQRVPVAQAIDALVLIWAASEADEWKDRIVEVPLR